MSSRSINFNTERLKKVLKEHGMNPTDASLKMHRSCNTLTSAMKKGTISLSVLEQLEFIGISEEEIESIKSVHDISVYKRDEKEETSSNTVSITNVSEQEMKDFMVYMKTIQELLYINNQLLKQILENWNK